VPDQGEAGNDGKEGNDETGWGMLLAREVVVFL
jgi:hypothetical protein